MSYFKLICEDEAIPFGGASKITQEFETEDMNHILGNITKFLQMSGYIRDDRYISLERTVPGLTLVDEDLDEYTEKLFAGTPIPKE
jgi:hypothetical protein